MSHYWFNMARFMIYHVDYSDVCVCPLVDGKEVLQAQDVSSCVCIMMKGYYFNKPFILMYRCDGLMFDRPGYNEFQVVDEMLQYMMVQVQEKFSALRDENDKPIDVKPLLSKLVVMGGQHRHVTTSGELLATGTEREVEAFRRYLLPCLRFSDSDYILAHDFVYRERFYLTEGDDCVDIRFNAKGQYGWRSSEQVTRTMDVDNATDTSEEQSTVTTRFLPR